jgi:DNA-binding MarR family transcriptional regulator
VRDAAERVGCSKDSVARALADLIAKGFIEVCSRGHFDRKSPRASEYRLTLYSCDRTGGRASKAFMSWRDDSPKSVAGLTRGTAGLTTRTVKPLAQENYLSRSHQRDRDPSFDASNGLTTGTHIIYHRSGA